MADEHGQLTVLLVEDHDLVRAGLIERLNAQPDIEVIAAAATVAAAIEQLAIVTPDVAVLDVELPDGNGIKLCRQIQNLSPATRCIIHTSIPIGPETAARAGATAVVLKQLRGTDLLDSIRQNSHWRLTRTIEQRAPSAPE